jgi:hypothetical protein
VKALPEHEAWVNAEWNELTGVTEEDDETPPPPSSTVDDEDGRTD